MNHIDTNVVRNSQDINKMRYLCAQFRQLQFLHKMVTDKTFSAHTGRSQYIRPSMRIICVRLEGILASSTEGYKNNEPDDWF